MTTPHSTLDVARLRSQFPALQQTIGDRPLVYFDGPGGTQAPDSVIEAMSQALRLGISNLGGPFLSSRRSDAIVDQARSAMQDLLNARSPDEIVFGQNMTSLTFSLSRALAQTWEPGDEIVVTRIDHDANISPWLRAAADRGVTVRWLDFRPEDCTLALDELPGLLNERTRLVAVNYASNAVGSITNVRRVAQLAHTVGALVYVDAVHYAPHDLIDVQVLDCDFLACSVYKFFGPHTGVVYGKYELLDRLNAYKVRPASDTPPEKWETGTQSFESLAGATAAVNYLAGLGGEGETRRRQIERGFRAIKEYEMGMSEYFLRRAARVDGLRVYGITDIEELARRTPTFAVSIAGRTPAEVAARLGERGIFVWHGHYYAVAVMERLGLLDKGGLVRIGFAHYNLIEEIDRLIEELASMV